VIKEKTERN